MRMRMSLQSYLHVTIKGYCFLFRKRLVVDFGCSIRGHTVGRLSLCYLHIVCCNLLQTMGIHCLICSQMITAPFRNTFSHPFVQWYVTFDNFSCPSKDETYLYSWLWYSEPASPVKFQTNLPHRHSSMRRVINWPSSGRSATVQTHRPLN
jgi:hypothetical protein